MRLKRSRERTLVNEFGEVLDDARLGHLARRVRQLSRKGIDELWYRVGWINLSGREDEQKALPTVVVDAIKRSHRAAKRQVEALLLEAREVSVLEALSTLEKEEMKGTEPTHIERRL